MYNTYGFIMVTTKHSKIKTIKHPAILHVQSADVMTQNHSLPFWRAYQNTAVMGATTIRQIFILGKEYNYFHLVTFIKESTLHKNC